MKLPRDISGKNLVAALTRLGYEVSHQSGSHIRLTTKREGEHHITVPNHSPIKVGTLSAILRSVADHHKLDRDDLIKVLFDESPG